MLFFFIALLRKWNYNVGGEELDNFEFAGNKMEELLYDNRRNVWRFILY